MVQLNTFNEKIKSSFYVKLVSSLRAGTFSLRYDHKNMLLKTINIFLNVNYSIKVIIFQYKMGKSANRII